MARKSNNKGFYVEGIEPTIRSMKLYSVEQSAKYAAIVKKTGIKGRSEAKKGAPVKRGAYVGKETSRSKPGDTKRSISLKFYDRGLHARVKPRLPKGWKAHFHEFGATGVGKGKIRIKEKSFMRNAAKSCEVSFNSEMKRVTERNVTI